VKRIWIFIAMAILLLVWGSCTTVKHPEVAKVAEKQTAAGDPYAVTEVVGYTTADAVYHPFKGYVSLAHSDSIRFYTEPEKKGKPDKPTLAPPLTFAFAQATPDVSSLAVRRTKVLATIGTAVAITAVVAAITVAIANSDDPVPQQPPSGTGTSCPLVYSWDGAQFVLDAEPYGGATIQALERTDVTALEHLVPSQGRYRLLLTNEMDETQHTNRIELLVVDHAPGLLVAPDADGAPHAFAAVHSLVEARDQAGHDLLPWLAERDEATWDPDLEAAARQVPLADTRDHLTLTFDRPKGATSAYLLADAATAPWGARMLRPMFAMRGVTLGLFYAAINGDADARQKLHEWNEREELFYLGVEVEEGGRWVRQGRLIGGGPIVAETRAIPLDLTRVTGDRVRVRVHPPVGFWMFNAFRLADREVPVHMQVVAPSGARDAAGRDALASLIATDRDYLTFATNEDLGVVDFPAPAQAEGTVRTVFARTGGWYEIRMRTLGLPDVAGIDRLTNQPGYAVQFALTRFRKSAGAWLAQDVRPARN